jgi:hypothetical protein
MLCSSPESVGQQRKKRSNAPKQVEEYTEEKGASNRIQECSIASVEGYSREGKAARWAAARWRKKETTERGAGYCSTVALLSSLSLSRSFSLLSSLHTTKWETSFGLFTLSHG